jgi:predicted nucleotidyltransferase
MKRQVVFPYLPKDFIETAEGLIFAVVSYVPQAGKIGCFLRYMRTASGWEKMATEAANQVLLDHYPHYLYHSQQFDAAFHAVKPQQVIQHYRPEHKLIDYLNVKPCDTIVQGLQKLIPILEQYGADSRVLGVTGSLLTGQQKITSDIDIVVYGRQAFHQTRLAVQEAVANKALMLLDDQQMQDNFQRRLGDLAYDDFAWHENRKFNKAIVDGIKFDIGMVNIGVTEKDNQEYQKRGALTLTANVVDDQFSFDYPARYSLDNKNISEVVAYTNTYVGQAKIGEKIEVSGAIECDIATDQCRLIVGSSREAVGEYIKVMK